MYLELHVIQNYAPSNLNRDDTGSPKDCVFGGARRARISSQCLKRAIRRDLAESGLLRHEDLAVRTKRLASEIKDGLIDIGHPSDEAEGVAGVALGAMGFGLGDDAKTEYLLFLGRREIEQIVALCAESWDELVTLRPSEDKRPKKGEIKLPEFKKQALSFLDGGRAVDLALFGRMLADLPERNTDAACQVAHAVSTHSVSVEFDYYTAVDDLLPEDTMGADMIGTVEFNSACFYRYLNLDIDTLARHLEGDADLLAAAVRAFVRAAILSVPTGKQNSMAAQNPPSFALAVVRERGLWSLANAFATPIDVKKEPTGLVCASVEALDRYWSSLVASLGDDQITGTYALSIDGAGELDALSGHTVENLEALVDGVVGTACSGVKG